MEPTTQLDLNKAVRQWREGLAQSPAFHPDNLDELEAHLRDSIESLERNGLSISEAFQIATQRLGGVEQLNAEYSKTNAAELWQYRGLWMLIGVLCYGLVGDFSRVIQAAGVFSGATLTQSGFALGWLSGGLRMAVFVATVWGFWRIAHGQVSGVEGLRKAFCRRPVLYMSLVCLAQLLSMAISEGLSMLTYSQVSPMALGQRFLLEAYFSRVLLVVHTGLLVAGVVWLGSKRSYRAGAARVAVCLLTCGLLFGSSQLNANAQIGSQSSTAHATPNVATLEDAMKFWRTTKQAEAVDKFLAIDFAKSPLFPAGSVLNLTEAEFVALPATARDKMGKSMIDDIQTLKLISARVKELAKTPSKSTLCLSQLRAAGEAFDRPGKLALLKLVGQTMKKMASSPP